MWGWTYVCCLHGQRIDAMVLGEFSETFQNALPGQCCLRVGLAMCRLTIAFKQSILLLQVSLHS